MPDKEPPKTETSIAPSSGAQIKDMIYTVQGQQVMLDSDLAELYGVETKELNQAVSRSSKRFPERLCFRITREEAESLRSQIVALRAELDKQDTWWRSMPRIFTERGVSMLSAVLRSDTVIDVSMRIMDAFVEMRHFIADNAHMFGQIRSIDHRLGSLEHSTDKRFERVFDYMETHEAPSQKVFFEGQVYDAFELLVSLVQRAKREIVLIDGYIDTATLNVLAKKQSGVSVTVWTHPKTSLSYATRSPARIAPAPRPRSGGGSLPVLGDGQSSASSN